MSIRLRLALWYGALFALILPVVALLTYAIHARSHYDALDQALITSAGHAVGEATAMGADPHLVGRPGGLEVVLRLYGPEGQLRESAPGAETVPEPGRGSRRRVAIGVRTSSSANWRCPAR